MIYSKYARSRKFFRQFGCKKRPCGGRLHARESRFDDRCPCCFCPDETDDHLLQCNHKDRQSWRKLFLLEKNLSVFFWPRVAGNDSAGFIELFHKQFWSTTCIFPRSCCERIKGMFPIHDFVFQLDLNVREGIVRPGTGTLGAKELCPGSTRQRRRTWGTST